MQKFDTAIQSAEAEVREAKAKVAALSNQIEGARSRLQEGGGIDIDIENATLEGVHSHNEAMNANIADLIMSLDEVTAGFSKDFDEMREERVRNSSVDDTLQDLISKSDLLKSPPSRSPSRVRGAWRRRQAHCRSRRTSLWRSPCRSPGRSGARNPAPVRI